MVFQVDDDRVIKLAKNKAGIAQNKVEANPHIQSAYGDIIAKIYDRHPDYLWLEQEAVTPMSWRDSEMFSKAAGLKDGVSWESVALILRYYKEEFNKRKKTNPEELFIDVCRSTYRNLGDTCEQISSNFFVHKVLQFIIEFDLPPQELVNDNVGMTSNGRPVILDYGFNQEIATNIYKTRPEAAFQNLEEYEAKKNEEVFTKFLDSYFKDKGWRVRDTISYDDNNNMRIYRAIVKKDNKKGFVLVHASERPQLAPHLSEIWITFKPQNERGNKWTMTYSISIDNTPIISKNSFKELVTEFENLLNDEETKKEE